MQVYEMNDYDKVCANSVEEAIRFYKDLTGVDLMRKLIN